MTHQSGPSHDRLPNTSGLVCRELRAGRRAPGVVRGAGVWMLGVAWLAAVATGFGIWERYDTTAGTAGPAAVAADLSGPGRWQLTIFAHPHCPCTRATLVEVAELARAAPDLSIRVLFVLPPSTPAGWERGGSWEAAERIPRAEVGADPDGTDARRFGAETSGQAVLIDPSGQVVFRGGLTRARGRAGESPGRRAVLDWVNGKAAAADAPVFGCPLFVTDD